MPLDFTSAWNSPHKLTSTASAPSQRHGLVDITIKLGLDASAPVRGTWPGGNALAPLLAAPSASFFYWQVDRRQAQRWKGTSRPAVSGRAGKAIHASTASRNPHQLQTVGTTRGRRCAVIIRMLLLCCMRRGTSSHLLGALLGRRHTLLFLSVPPPLQSVETTVFRSIRSASSFGSSTTDSACCSLGATVHFLSGNPRQAVLFDDGVPGSLATLEL